VGERIDAGAALGVDQLNEDCVAAELAISSIDAPIIPCSLNKELIMEPASWQTS
jgi:hypothetical protein